MPKKKTNENKPLELIVKDVLVDNVIQLPLNTSIKDIEVLRKGEGSPKWLLIERAPSDTTSNFIGQYPKGTMIRVRVPKDTRMSDWLNDEKAKLAVAVPALRLT